MTLVLIEADLLGVYRKVDIFFINLTLTNFKKRTNAFKCYVTHLRATERHLPYGIKQCYLPPDTGVNAPRLNISQIGWYSIYLPRRNERLS